MGGMTSSGETPRSKRSPRWRRIFLGLLGLLTLFALAYIIAPPVDIRPGSILDGISEEEAARGRALIERLPEAYGGLTAFESKRSSRVEMSDHWPSPIMRLVSPWKEGETLIFSYAHRGDEGTIEFVGGPRAGHRWRFENGRTSGEDETGAREEVSDADVRFWVPTIEYFLEMPFRLLEADIVAHAGTREIDGEAHDLLYVTWRNAAPQADIDQYLVWVSQESGRISYVEYTVRDFGKRMQGAMQYADFREVDGIVFPYRMTSAPLGEDIVHRFTVDSIVFDEARSLDSL